MLPFKRSELSFWRLWVREEMLERLIPGPSVSCWDVAGAFLPFFFYFLASVAVFWTASERGFLLFISAIN